MGNQQQWATVTVCSKTASITQERTEGRLDRSTRADKVAGLSLTRPWLITCGSSQERDVWSLAVDQQKIRLGGSGVAQGQDGGKRTGGIVWLGSVGI